LGIIAFPSFPLIIFGLKSLLKYLLAFLQLAKNLWLGVPTDFIIRLSCYCSLSPAKSGVPRLSSATKHPKLHMSMGVPYFAYRMTSGAR
jgi:hypothetical protein